ncbi:photoactive yellow protein [Methylotenera versatilis 301]|uniref:Photoactive yellow protein n=1 Tax=Methylotenera versatilis (strain 301) TaxID=666681 RepID=D7DKK8_METV0|nr:phosphonate transporter [Methylotenera versatilis]ADI30454.1 photoactive yellow protein [Methylotenera versatilis 301]
MNQITFDMLSLGQTLDKLTNDQLNSLDFGVIGFDNEGMVKVYNAYESKVAGLSLESVIDSDLFNSVAPCMNNFMVAQKFEDAVDTSSELDEIMDYVLTLKMKPTRVKLRLLSSPQFSYSYVVILRS